MRAVWAQRAAEAERAVTSRYLHRLGGVVPATRIGRTRHPRQRGEWRRRPFGPWNYWWQAHLLDCLLDAQLRAPSAERAAALRALLRGIRLHNAGRWTNDYYDDIAWLGLAVQRAGVRLRPGRHAVGAITSRLRAGHTGDGGGGIWWRRGDDFKNAPANGPAAILLARTGEVARAAALVDWMAGTLVDPATGLVRDGVRLDPLGRIRETVATTYTYCQGVYLGACLELADRDGDPRWAQRAGSVVAAVATHQAEPDGVVRGYDDGGDGGLFNGILARYLAAAAVRSAASAGNSASEVRSAASAGNSASEVHPQASAGAVQARTLVLASGEAVWRNRAETSHGPAFAHDWRRPARPPLPGTPEADLSVQLSGWMLMEAAARVERGR